MEAIRLENDRTTENKIKALREKMTPKRQQIVLALYENGEMRHGDVAKVVSSSAASLSNILKFEGVEELIRAENVGKYRYYSLTDLGTAYASQLTRNRFHINENVIEFQEGRLYQQAESAFQKYTKLCGEQWKLNMDDALSNRKQHQAVSGESERLVDEYLLALELMQYRDEETAYLAAIQLLGNEILIDRVGSFLEEFKAFHPVIRDAENEADVFRLGELLTSVVCGRDTGQAKAYAQELGWSDEEYEKLYNTLSAIAGDIEGVSKEERYRCMSRYLPEQGALAYMLAAVMEKNVETRDVQ